LAKPRQLMSFSSPVQQSGTTLQRGPIIKNGDGLTRTCPVEMALTDRSPAPVSRIILQRSATCSSPSAKWSGGRRTGFAGAIASSW
jgi:hypothetical protein